MQAHQLKMEQPPVNIRALLLASIASTAICAGAFAQDEGEAVIPPASSEQSQPADGSGTTEPSAGNKTEPNAPKGADAETEQPVKKGSGQAETNPEGDQTGDKNAAQSGENEQSEKKKTAEDSQSDATKNAEGGNTAGTNNKKAKTEITAEKKTVIKNKVVNKDVKRVERTSINFDVSVGVAVPRTVNLVVLPAAVVEVVPEYEGYLYFVLDDGTLVIVEPGTMEIVYVIA